MIVRCKKCRRVRIDPETVRLVLDNDIASEAWADAIEDNDELKWVGVCWVKECPLCERKHKGELA